MQTKKTNIHLLLALFHLGLGVLLLSGFISKVYSLLIVVIAIRNIVKTKNSENQAILWSAYMMGGEVLFRMSGGMIFHELPKYSILLFLGLGLFVEKRRHHISVSYVFYILLLLIGISFMDIPFTESIRKAIAFNLSGPILLGLSAIYFYRREINIETLFNSLLLMLLPVISMLSFLYFKTPDVEKIKFGGGANFAASGGFGPNQVATVLGFGFFILAVFMFFKKRIFSRTWIDFSVFLYIIYRSLLTFSRGGVLTAILALVAFMFYFIVSSKNKSILLIKYTGISLAVVLTTTVYTVVKTNGMLTNRYTNKNAAGVVKEDFTTGRAEIFTTEMEGFFEHPYFGLGVGGSKYYRLEKIDKFAASHNEIGRLISEHGMIGLVILILLIIIPAMHILSQPYLARAFLSAFLLFWFLTINHSAMRIAFPAFIYGLSLIRINFNNSEDTQNSIT